MGIAQPLRLRILQNLAIFLGLGGVWLLLTIGSGNASFPDIGLGARPMGMGGAFVALADDANAIFWNPAGLIQLQRIELTSMSVRLYGLDVTSQLLSGVFHHPYSGAIGVGVLRTGETGLYTEESFLLSLGQDLFPLLRTHLSLGANGKLLRKGYQNVDLQDPLFANGTQVSSLSYDVGFLWRLWGDTLRVGGMVENAVPTPASLDSTDASPIPPVFRVGVALQPNRQLSVVLEGVERHYPSSEFMQRSGRAGVEWRPVGSSTKTGSGVMLRAGGRVAQSAGEFDATGYLGGGLQLDLENLPTVRLDYAFSIPVLTVSEPPGSNHRFSLSLAFGEMKTLPRLLIHPTADPSTIQNCEILTLRVESESGLSVWVDVSELDITQSKRIALAEKEPGTYSISIVISEDNTADNGPKTITFTATDATGNLTEPVTVTVELRNLSGKLSEEDQKSAEKIFEANHRDGTRYFGKGDYPKAIQSWKVALLWLPSQVIRDNITNAYTMWLDNPDKGQQLPSDQAQQVRNQQQAWRRLTEGYAAYLSQDYPTAIAQFEESLKSDNDLTEAYKWLGCAAFEAGRRPEAEAAFRELIQRQPDLILTGKMSEKARYFFNCFKVDLSKAHSPSEGKTEAQPPQKPNLFFEEGGR